MEEPTGTWDEAEGRLAAILAALTVDEFVVVGEPPFAPEKPRGLLRRTPPPPPHRYVQFLKDDGDWLYGECVGATLFGGDWEIAQPDHERIRSMGWLAPGDPDEAGTQPSYPHYWCTLPGDRPAAAAGMGVGALQVLGVEPAVLAWQHERR